MAVEVMEPSSCRFSKSLPDVAVADTVVPESYKWPVHELSPVAHDDYSEDEVPVIDLEVEDLNETRRSIREAIANWGIFQVVNHGVSLELLYRMRTMSKKFFDLPLETKEKLKITPEGGRLIGYGSPRPNNKLQTSRRVWSEGLFVDIPHVADFASTLWPKDDPTGTAFCDTMEEYFQALRELGARLFRMVLESLGVSVGEADSARFVPQEPGLVRLNHYPPCPEPELTTGLVPHHDANLLTLLQQGDVGGLQVLKDGRWVAVRPLPGAFAVNAGNMLQAISNGLCLSALHRAVVNKNESRISAAYFVHAPDWDQILPLPELIDEDHPAKYRPFTWTKYLDKQYEYRSLAVETSNGVEASHAVQPYNALQHFAIAP